MTWTLDPASVQDPTTNVVAVFGWGDAVNGALNFLRGAKAGCRCTSLVGTATGTDTVLPWATETYDVNTCHDNVTNNSRITVPAGWAGLWYVCANLACTSGLFTVQIVVNATTRIAGASSNTSGSVDTATTVETVYPMAAGDYFETWVTGGSTRSTSQTSSFTAHWLHGI